MAQKIVTEGLDHKATVAEVSRRRRGGSKRGSKRTGRGVRTVETSVGKLTFTPRRDAGPESLLIALREALARLEAEPLNAA